MSIDVDEAIKLIRDMATMIDPDEDYLSIAETKDRIATSKADRKKTVDDAHADFKALAKTLDAARTSSTRPSSVLSAEAHASALNELDVSGLTLGKAISGMEGLVASKEAELSSLKERARQLEDCDPAAEHERELDSTALRLRIFKGLGFEPIHDNKGNLTKMLVGSLTGDIQCVQFDGRHTEVEYTEQLWTAAIS
ncbi:uncharacterized protein BT62DRAFT_1070404 [Guyanagaster necrorhizus]|uniref:Kinetochore protein Spc24 n=1 Tax=Guyanagaster necrorhizus TaxID=856835 RepID=A0A9P8AYW6_9AGAR|nr:uncharacterized protein BT62DRAFT_1070404 [Guyanagaster necrorhizus MCA 3950]KAG7452661.1 hypothetical protein BT62DRAFT_1070404 [Guyanagaster necrorhizus MCA 3950]